MSDKTKRKQPPQTFWQKYRLLKYSAWWLAFLLLLIVCTAVIRLPLPEILILYPLPSWLMGFFCIGGFAFYIAFAFFCIMLMVCIAQFFAYKHIEHNALILLGTGFLSSFALFMLAAVSILPDSNDLAIVHRTIFADHVYYIVFRNDDMFDGFPPDSYAIYECDSLEIRCGLLMQTEKDFYNRTSTDIIVDE
ncbi:MAG: hypothetical protein ACPG7F_15210, partial [Aggregatilineales bacterium]